MLLLVCGPEISRVIFFVAFNGRHLSNSSIREISEKKHEIFSNLTEAMKKKKWRKYVASVTVYFVSDMECPKKERPTIEGAVNQFLSF